MSNGEKNAVNTEDNDPTTDGDRRAEMQSNHRWKMYSQLVIVPLWKITCAVEETKERKKKKKKT